MADLPLILTGAEKRALACAVRGLSAKESARELAVSPRTVEVQLAAIRKKTNCHRTNVLIARLYASGKIRQVLYPIQVRGFG